MIETSKNFWPLYQLISQFLVITVFCSYHALRDRGRADRQRARNVEKFVTTLDLRSRYNQNPKRTLRLQQIDNDPTPRGFELEELAQWHTANKFLLTLDSKSCFLLARKNHPRMVKGELRTPQKPQTLPGHMS